MSKSQTILIAEDKDLTRECMVKALEAEGYDVIAAASAREGRAAIESKMMDAAFIDLGLGDGDGRDLLDLMQELSPEVPVTIVTAVDTAVSAVELMRRGAYDYVVKPVKPSELIRRAQRSIELCTAKRALTALRDARVREQGGWDVGETSRLRAIEGLVNRFAPTDAGILIQGESGTGKEAVARALHERSDRADGPFIAINCAAIPEHLLESELFGHEKGSFSGAVATRKGMLELAHRGTLFLDEVTTMPLEMQATLLRALQEFRFRRVGGQKELKVDVRIVSATNQSVVEAIDQERFRHDLFYRLCVMTIELPPLRERVVDIPFFVEKFIGELREKTGTTITDCTESAMWALCRYRWPGNIRELRNAIERAVIFATGEEKIDVGHLPTTVRAVAGMSDRRGTERNGMGLEGDANGSRGGAHGIGYRFGSAERPVPVDAHDLAPGGGLPAALPPSGLDMKGTISRWEQCLVEQALTQTSGNQSAAARLLGLTRDELRYRVEKYALNTES